MVYFQYVGTGAGGGRTVLQLPAGHLLLEIFPVEDLPLAPAFRHLAGKPGDPVPGEGVHRLLGVGVLIEDRLGLAVRRRLVRKIGEPAFMEGVAQPVGEMGDAGIGQAHGVLLTGRRPAPWRDVP